MRPLYSTTLSFFITLLMVTTSCHTNQDNPSPTSNSNNSVISKKWDISESSNTGRTTSTSNYISFEFSAYGKFLIRKADSTFIEGDYTYNKEDGIITLVNIGSIKISTLTTNSFSFVLTLTGEEAETIFSTEAPKLPSNTQTDKFARIWKLTQQLINNVDSNPYANASSIYVIVTPYGTHMLVYKDLDSNAQYFAEVWKWSDQTYNTICVGETTPNCDSPLSITFPTNNTMIAEYDEPEGHYKETYEILVP